MFSLELVYSARCSAFFFFFSACILLLISPPLAGLALAVREGSYEGGAAWPGRMGGSDKGRGGWQAARGRAVDTSEACAVLLFSEARGLPTPGVSWTSDS